MPKLMHGQTGKYHPSSYYVLWRRGGDSNFEWLTTTGFARKNEAAIALQSLHRQGFRSYLRSGAELNSSGFPESFAPSKPDAQSHFDKQVPFGEFQRAQLKLAKQDEKVLAKALRSDFKDAHIIRVDGKPEAYSIKREPVLGVDSFVVYQGDRAIGYRHTESEARQWLADRTRSEQDAAKVRVVEKRAIRGREMQEGRGIPSSRLAAQALAAERVAMKREARRARLTP